MDTTQRTLNSNISTFNNNASTLNSTTSGIVSRPNRRSSKSKRKSHCRAFKDTVNEYASSSSAHGITYIFESGRLPLERFFWIIGVGFALIFR